MKKLLLLAVTFGLLFTAQLFAQPGCPSVTIPQATGGVYNLPCGQSCANLTATAFAGSQTTAYTVSPITYAPPFSFNSGTQILIDTDDRWSGLINLPFQFCFFGGTYSQVVIGSNGVVSFRTANANTYNSFNSSIPIPTANPVDITNCIMGPWQDIDPSNQGQVFYEIGGVSPCRYFKVSWYDVPYYGSLNSTFPFNCPFMTATATQQIVMYETSNVIEMYIQDKEVCANWLQGKAVQGIQNANGTVAYTVTGRNATAWTAHNDAHRFTPSGTANYTIAWLQGNTPIGSGSSISVCPTTSTTYTAQATYNLCAGNQIVVEEDVLVNVSSLTSNVDSIHQISCFNGNDGAVFASYSSSVPITSFGWSPGGAGQASLTGLSAGTYIFSVTDQNNCTTYDTVVLANPAPFTVSVNDTSLLSCVSNPSTGALTAVTSGGNPGFTFLWNPGSLTGQTITGLANGTYTVIVTDTTGCTASDAGTVTIVNSNPTFNPASIVDATCGNINGSIAVSLTGAVDPINFAWSNSLPNNDTVTGLAGGTYTVTATDFNGCSVSASYTVGQTGSISFDAPVIDNADCAGNGGSITVTVIGASGAVTYTWSNGLPNSATVTNLAPGTYTVTADDNGCTASASYTVGQDPALTLGTPVITNANCTGTGGSIVVTVNGATGTITYNWSNSLPDNDTVTGLTPGTYTVTVSDATTCTATASYTVGQDPSFTFGPATIDNASCVADDGSIIVHVIGGTPAITYVWSPNVSTNDTATGLGSGIYFVTATDATGCSASAAYPVAKSSPFSVDSAVITDADCGASNGSILVFPTGATPQLTYAWTPSGNTNPLTGLAAGTYTVTVTDANGCIGVGTYTVGQGNGLSFNPPVITDAGCAGNDGSITVNPNSTATPINYNWNPTQANSNTITNLAPGAYSVTATDNNGCSGSVTYNVGQNSALNITNAVVTDVSCTGVGSISLTVTGGTGTITYAWSPSGSGNPLTGLAAGTYTVSISDQGGCSATATYLVGSTPCGDCPAVSTDNNVTIACGETCANLTASAVAGYQTTTYTGAPIAYNPFPYNTGTPIIVNTDDVFSDVIPLPFNFCFFGQTYDELIVASNGMVSFNTAFANTQSTYDVQAIPSPPNFQIPDQTNSIMGAWHDLDPTFKGDIRFDISGVYPCRRFVVSWFDVPMFGDPNSLVDGICTDTFHQTQQIVLYETTNVIDIYIQEKEVCLGWNSGWAVEGIQNDAGTLGYTVPGRNATVWTASNDGYRFTPSGAPNYQINWYDGNTLISSNDSVTVCPDSTKTYRVDALYINCANDTVTVSDSVIVTVLGNVTVNIDSFTAPSCNGGNNGAVYASYDVTNSTIVSFGWTPGGPGQLSLTGIPAGTYIFSATNSTGCTDSDTILLGEPDSLVAFVPDTTLYNCVAGPVSVDLTATASGGTPAYGFDWGGGNTNPILSGVGTGTYTVTVTDANGCTASDAGIVTLIIADPIFNTPVINNVTCNGAADGNITVSVSQATPVVTYDWATATPDSSTVTNLGPGTYDVTATDANGCSVTASYTITEPTAIVIGTPTITDAGCTVGGTITVTATGGTGTLTYNWSNQDSGTFIDSLNPGNYTLTVRDANGCTATATFTVNAAPGAVVLGTPVITNLSCNGGSNGSIHVVVTGGTGTLVYVWNPISAGTDSTADGLTAGTYCVTVTDGAGCSASACYTITAPPAITIGNPNITPGTCNVGGIISVTATGGTGALVYSWSNGATGNTVDSLACGPVSLTVTDANGCSTSATYNVPCNSIAIANTVVTNISCNGANDGSIHVGVTGGVGPLVYNWNPNSAGTDSTADGLPAGTYCVTVTDNGGCTATACYTITEPTAVVITDTTVVDGSCSGGGSITLTVNGGTGAYTYQWSGGLTGNPATNVAAGSYSVTVRDANGCSVTGGVYTVAGATGGPLTFGNAIVNNSSCNGVNNGSITVSATGGNGTITYTWNTTPPQTSATIINLAPGTYCVTASDGGGCSASACYNITEPAALTAQVNATDLLCFGAGDGTATAVVSGGTGNYTYLWNPNNGTGPSISNLPVGIVLLTVTDANGCSATASDIIGQSPSISYNSQVNQPSCADLGRGTEILTPRGGTGTIRITIPGLNLDTVLSMTGADTALVIPGVPTGNYTFTLTDQVGCPISGFFFVEAGAANQTFDIATDSTTCYGDKFNNGGLTVTPVTQANGPYSYSVDGGSFQTDSNFTNLSAGNHTVVVSNKYGCLDTLTATIEQPAQLVVNAVPDTIFTGVNIENQINVNIENFVSNPVYVWSPSGGLSCDSCDKTTAAVAQNTVYYVVVLDSAVEGCQASDSVIIIVSGELKMPNAFSPNADGFNDTYGPVKVGEQSALTITAFRIYNRWGQSVHNANENWDGKFNGQLQPAGTYIYYISVKTPDPNNSGQDKTISSQGAFTLLH